MLYIFIKVLLIFLVVIFNLPENEKILFCEKFRALGNYLYSEGIYPKAAEQYQLCISYYEYCFPDNDAEQIRLDELRHVCLCNISLCYYHMILSSTSYSYCFRSFLKPTLVGSSCAAGSVYT
jgi:hypothetical protein